VFFEKKFIDFLEFFKIMLCDRGAPSRNLLRVDLSNRKIEREEVPTELFEKFIGGKGLAAYYAYKELKGGIDPLSPDNKLFIFVGCLTGIFPGFTRYVVASKSPLTGLFCDSYAGGKFGYELVKSSYLGIIVEGKAERPVLLKVEGDLVELADASIFSGKGAYETCALLRPFSAMVIGEAGRRMVRYACILNDLVGAGRAGVLGRGGLGAVMGSKNLYAIAVQGKLSDHELVPPESSDKVKKVYIKALEYLRNYVVKGIDLGGNLPAVEMSAGAKVLPINNFQRGCNEWWERLAVPEIRKYTLRKHTCPLCPLACGVHVKVGDAEVERLEYETVALNGFNCGHMDLNRVVSICKTCNDLGLDTMSAGVVVAFAMECTERGVYDFGVKFGDFEGHLRLLERIALREGEGKILAEGVKRASERVGAKELALQIKGLEFPGYDPRGVVGMALAYATADRGADHLRAWTIVSELKNPFTIEGKAELTKYLQDRNAALWTLICCDNIPANTTGDPEAWVGLCVEMLESIGRSIDKEEFLKIGERIYNLTRLFNVREGVSRKDDALPLRMLEPRSDTGWRIRVEDFERLLDAYYSLRGWSREGIPTEDTLNRLGLNK
jgi:aldehyde:ferredoxin oxidoreductase